MVEDRKHKVNILLSTYNGQDYVRQQIDSILNQNLDGLDMRLYIRDDGSKDNTRIILEEYAKANEAIILVDQEVKENIGYIKSFWRLLEFAGEADYYAFADQDDYWLTNKIKNAIDSLERADAKKPLLYSSYFCYCDDKLEFTGTPPVFYDKEVTLQDMLFYTPAFGFTIVINSKMKEMATNDINTDCLPHDRWCQMIAATCGEIIFGKEVDVKYRRHSQTVTTADTLKINMIKQWIKNDILGTGNETYYYFLQRLYEEFHDSLSSREIDLIQTFTTKKGNYIKKLFFPKRLRPTIGGEIALRLCFLLNR